MRKEIRILRNTLGESFQVHSTVNCTTETEGIQWEKAALNPLVSRWSVSFEFSFMEERPDLHTPLHQTNKQTLTTSKYEITPVAVYLMNRGKSSHMN